MDFRRASQLRCRPKTQIGPAAFEVSRLQEVITSRISRGLPANDGNGGKLPLLFRTFRYKNVCVRRDNMFAAALDRLDRDLDDNSNYDILLRHSFR